MSKNIHDAIADLIAAQARLTEASATLIELYVDEAAPEKETEKPTKKAPDEDAEPAKKSAQKPTEKADPEPAKKSAQKPTEKADPEPAPEPEDSTDDKGRTFTLAEVQKVVIAVSKQHGRDEAKALIAKYTPNGAHDLKLVPEKNFEKLYEAAVELTSDA